MALTTDFSGTYDYEREEARAVAASFIEGLSDGYYRDSDEYHRAVIKERNHWAKDTGFNVADFADEFNRITVPVCLSVFGKEIYF